MNTKILNFPVFQNYVYVCGMYVMCVNACMFTCMCKDPNVPKFSKNLSLRNSVQKGLVQRSTLFLGN